jgi:hypothetical protein
MESMESKSLATARRMRALEPSAALAMAAATAKGATVITYSVTLSITAAT